MKIAVIDYGLGNIYSIQKAFEYHGVSTVLTSSEKEIEESDAIVLPGVGAFENGMQALRKEGLDNCIKAFASTNKPILGICLGMQLLCNRSYEFGDHDGLGLISGEVMKFPIQYDSRNQPKYKVPHIGWAKIFENIESFSENPLLKEIKVDSEMYFVHSYFVKTDKEDCTIAKCDFEGNEFSAIINNGNIFGCQFHPEKSGENGLRLILNFIKLVSHLREREV